MAIDRGQYRFTVKEYAGWALFLAAEPAGDRLKHLSGDQHRTQVIPAFEDPDSSKDTC